jgi:acyl-CoA reductase-like NAD-dependent aldehyde dehydrogenase
LAVGRLVEKAAAGRLIPVGLELGGKDPAYIREDVDLDWAAAEIVDGAIFNSGQSCCSIERVYVHEKVHDDFVQAVIKVLAGYKLGDPRDPTTQIGPVVSKRSLATIHAHIRDAVDKGAVDSSPEVPSQTVPPKGGNYIKPTLLTNVTHDMDVMNEETFGPVIPVMKVGNDEEAIRLMNDSEFGLTASIWTKNVAEGELLAEQVEAGTVFVNRCDFPSPVSFIFSVRPLNECLTCKGSGMDGVENLRQGSDPEQIRLRAICQIKELSCEGLSKIGCLYSLLEVWINSNA